MISPNTIIDTASGHKLIWSGGSVTGYDFWTPPVYPNASQPDGGGADHLHPANCSTGCLFDILSVGFYYTGSHVNVNVNVNVTHVMGG